MSGVHVNLKHFSWKHFFCDPTWLSTEHHPTTPLPVLAGAAALVTPSPSNRGWSSARSSAASAWGDRPGGGWAHAAHETPAAHETLNPTPGGTVPGTPALADARSARRADAPKEEPVPAASEQWRYNSAFDAVGAGERMEQIAMPVTQSPVKGQSQTARVSSNDIHRSARMGHELLHGMPESDRFFADSCTCTPILFFRQGCHGACKCSRQCSCPHDVS